MTTCMVCGWLADGGGRCRWCGWDPNAATSASDPLADRLRAARRRHDGLAILRVASLPDRLDLARAARLETRFVRDAPLGDDERRLLVDRIDRDRTALPQATLDEVARAELRRLVGGETCGIAFFEVDPYGVRWFTVDADEIGTPRLNRAVTSALDWRAIAPSLSDDPDERSFQLAGGRGPDPVDLQAIDQALWRTLHAPSSRDSCWSKVLIRGTAGWSIIDRAIAVLSETGPRHVEARSPRETDPASLVASLIALAPLRHPYELALAAVDETSGEVRVETIPLFPAGATESTPAAAVSVAALPSDLERVSLPIVVRHGAAPDEWHTVAVGSIALPPGASTRVTVGLAGPGSVRFSSLRDVQLDTRTWPELLALVPPRALRGGPPLDLVFAVELAGDRAVVEQRVRLVQAAADRFASAVGSTLRVALVGYHDHVFRHDQTERSPLVHVQQLDAPGPALNALRGWELGSEVRHDYAAPAEDALAELGRIAWRHGSRRVLVLLAGRPPHPAVQQEDLALPCPYRLDWSSQLGAARRDSSLTCLAVTGPGGPPADPGAARRAFAAWAELGAAGIFPLGSDPGDLPDRMLAAAGVTGEDGFRPVPLAVVVRGSAA